MHFELTYGFNDDMNGAGVQVINTQGYITYSAKDGF